MRTEGETVAIDKIRMKHSNYVYMFLSGMVKAFDFNNAIDIYKRNKKPRSKIIFELYGDHQSDRDRLANDWRTIGNDMQKSIHKYGELNGIK